MGNKSFSVRVSSGLEVCASAHGLLCYSLLPGKQHRGALYLPGQTRFFPHILFLMSAMSSTCLEQDVRLEFSLSFPSSHQIHFY